MHEGAGLLLRFFDINSFSTLVNYNQLAAYGSLTSVK